MAGGGVFRAAVLVVLGSVAGMAVMPPAAAPTAEAKPVLAEAPTAPQSTQPKGAGMPPAAAVPPQSNQSGQQAGAGLLTAKAPTQLEHQQQQPKMAGAAIEAPHDLPPPSLKEQKEPAMPQATPAKLGLKEQKDQEAVPLATPLPAIAMELHSPQPVLSKKTTEAQTSAQSQPEAPKQQKQQEAKHTPQQDAKESKQPDLSLPPPAKQTMADTSSATSAPSSAPDCSVGGGHPNSKRWMIGVVTAPAHVAARNAIRESFGKNAQALDVDVKYFVASLAPDLKDREKVATQLLQEQDIVASDKYVDSYENLAHKTKHIMEYAYENCYAGVMKVDDDTYLHVDRIQAALMENGLEESYAGKFFQNSPVIQNSKSKWYGYDQYPHEFWPSYACGAAYYVGRKGLKHITDLKDQASILRIEDAGTGIWLEHAGMKRLDMSGRANVLDYNLNPNAFYHNPLNPSEMAKVQAGIMDFELKACDKNEEFGCACRNSPYYSDADWDACMAKFVHGEYDEEHVAGGPRLALLAHMMVQMSQYA